jgi:hypothetical protein
MIFIVLALRPFAASASLRLKFSEVLGGGKDFLEEFVLIHRPIFAGEYLDLGEAGEASLADHFQDAGGGVDPFAGEATI